MLFKPSMTEILLPQQINGLIDFLNPNNFKLINNLFNSKSRYFKNMNTNR